VIGQQATIGSECSVGGAGLHTGARTTTTFKPAPPNHGIRFRRTDCDPPCEIPADIEYVPSSTEVPRNTTLRRGDVSIHTVEHVLAAVSGLGIHNVLIEIDGPEPCEPSEGCLTYVQRLHAAGVRRQGVPLDPYVVRDVVQLREGDVELTAVPNDRFRVSFTIRYDNPLIGTQHISLDVEPESFMREIAPARTFALMSEVRQLQESGFIRGGSLDNAVVVDGDHILNETPLRFPDEFVRHKVLDLLGDLALLGQPIRGHIIAVRSGHRTNTAFVRRMHTAAASARPTKERSGLWDVQDILEVMPHRYPFMLVDRILEFEDRKRVVAIKNVTYNEPFFQGHFPGHPVMPAVLIVEAMAQCGGVLLLNSVDEPGRRLLYFSGIDRARFRRPVRPGDQLRFELELLRFGGSVCKMEGKAFVDETVVAEATLLATIVER
jgi:UDP-3-O-[3-hydroxymyristoyl] N-acetylglucosamine deacetylase/3-hydroxyacyl-[acyl-carrier-protein] dehydratase